tara:strand:+ start:328 stop:1332 length:1005 start_codon:yes stop_codon:yes gene_type:complete
MKAIICKKPGIFEEIEQQDPVPSKGETIVKIKKIGICGTDYHAFKGQQPFFTYPRILGHELAAEVVDSNEVFTSGQAVAPIPYLHCKKCKTCLAGKPNCCPKIKTMGVHVDGGMREFTSIPNSNLVRADGLTDEQIATVECLAIGAHAVRRSQISKGQWAAVVGTGPIGIGTLHFARLSGAKTIAIDINEERLLHCKEVLGVDHCINALQNPIDALKDLTNGDLADVVYEATGAPVAMENSFNYVGHGGKLVLVSIVKGKISFEDPLFHSREMTVMSSRNATHEDFNNVMNALREQKIDISPFVTHRCQFDELTSLFEKWSNPDSKVIKGIVSF